MNTLRCVVVAGLTLACLAGGCRSRQAPAPGPAGTATARTTARLAAAVTPPTFQVERWAYPLTENQPTEYVWHYSVTDGGPGSGDPVASYVIEFVGATDQPNHEAVIGDHLQWKLTSGYAVVRGTFPAPPSTKESLLLPFWRLFSMNNVTIGVDGCDFVVEFYPPVAPATEPSFRVYLADASDGHTVKILTGASSNWISVGTGSVYLATGSAEATDDSNSAPSTVLSEGYQSRIEALAQAAANNGVPESNSTNIGGSQ